MKPLILLILLSINIYSQNLKFPADMYGNDIAPSFPLIGDVRTVSSTSYRNGILIGGVTVEQYDSDRRMFEKITQQAGVEIHSGKLGSLGGKQYFLYRNGRVSEIRSFDSYGTATTVVKFSYNANGFLEEMRLFDPNGVLADKITYLYEPTKKEVSVTVYGYYKTHVLTDKQLLQYDDKGRWIKKTNFDKFGKAVSSVSFEHDEKGFLIKDSICCDDGSFNKYQYKLDTRGNWVEKIQTNFKKNGEGKWSEAGSTVTYRVLTYFSETESSVKEEIGEKSVSDMML